MSLLVVTQLRTVSNLLLTELNTWTREERKERAQEALQESWLKAVRVPNLFRLEEEHTKASRKHPEAIWEMANPYSECQHPSTSTNLVS